MADQIVGDVKAVGADIKSEGSKVWAFITNRWPHFVTWVGLVYTFLKAHL